MKAWELIKHLEEGGGIEAEDGTKRTLESYQKTWKEGGHILDFLLRNPENYKIVKPKKKIQFYRYTFLNSYGVVEQSVWLSIAWESWGRDSHKLMQTETKEIEVEDVA